MNQHPFSSAPSLRFRRWSRKAYAAFASVGRHVTIGCVHKGIADRSLAKQVSTGIKAGCAEGGQILGKQHQDCYDDAPPDYCLIDLLKPAVGEILPADKANACRKGLFGVDRVCACLYTIYTGQTSLRRLSGDACLFRVLSQSDPRHHFNPKTTLT